MIELRAELAGLGLNLPPAFFRRQNDEVLAQLAFVIRRGHRNRRRTQLAMAARDIAALHTGDLKRNYLTAQQRDNPANGTNKPRPRFSARPVHRFRPLDAKNGCGQRFGEKIAHWAAGNFFSDGPTLLTVGHNLEVYVGNRKFVFLDEAFSGAIHWHAD